MLTTKRLNNLIIYWLIFRYNDDSFENTGQIGSHYEYISEKYDIFFNHTLDNVSTHKIHWDSQILWNDTVPYMKHWKLDLNDFINKPEFPKYLFTTNLMYRDSETFKSNDAFIDKLLERYNMFFDSYDHISEENLSHILHKKIQDIHTILIEQCSHRFRNLMIKQLIKK